MADQDQREARAALAGLTLEQLVEVLQDLSHSQSGAVLDAIRRVQAERHRAQRAAVLARLPGARSGPTAP